jgi:hypothetical protein
VAIIVAIPVVAVSLLLLSTPACDRRAFLGITVDRTLNPQCTIPPVSGAKEEPVRTTTPKQGVEVETKEPVEQDAVPFPDISFNKDGREEFRKRYGLNIVEAESATMAETPKGSFGFAYGGSFATVWKDKIETLTIRATSRSVHFEIQKRDDGHLYIVGYMRGDSANEIVSQKKLNNTIRLYSDRYKDTDAIVAIPVELIKGVGQSTIDINNTSYIPVLDISFDT